MIKKTLLFFAILILHELHPIIVGSKSVASSQTFTLFPAADTNNSLVGFASFENGFMLENATTTCTFDNFMRISGPVNLNSGRLTLRNDMIFANEMLLLNGGVIEGNNHSINLPHQATTFNFPFTTPKNIASSAVLTLENESLSDARTIDWKAGTNNYLAVGQRVVTGSELKLLYFSGNTITVTAQANLNREVTSVRWHPTQSYLAVTSVSNAGDEIEIYRHNVSNGTFTKTSGADLASNASSVAWHPSGNYLIIGTDNDSNELIIYSFSPIAGTISGRVNINIASNQDVNREALSFSPGGNRLGVGVTNNTTTNISEILVYNFNGTTLTLSTSLDVGNNVNAVDWSPTGSYIATGLTGCTSNIRLYKVTNGPIREVTTARQNESRDIYSVHWHPSGQYLVCGVNSGVANELRIFYFDSLYEILTEITGINSYDEIWTTRWSRDGTFLAHGLDTLETQHQIRISTFVNQNSPMTLQNTSVVCNSNVNLNNTFYIKNVCRINGNNKDIFLTNQSELVVRPGGQLILENAHIYGLKSNNMRCMTDNGKITLNNCSLMLDRDFTFSRGSLLIVSDVIISGTSTFTFSPSITSTISANSTLYLDTDLVFRYAPLTNKNNLLLFESSASKLYLNGCSLQSTTTGMLLTQGTLILDNKVTLSSAANRAAESIKLREPLTVNLRGGALLDLHGYITYE